MIKAVSGRSFSARSVAGFQSLNRIGTLSLSFFSPLRRCDIFPIAGKLMYVGIIVSYRLLIGCYNNAVTTSSVMVINFELVKRYLILSRVKIIKAKKCRCIPVGTQRTLSIQLAKFLSCTRLHVRYEHTCNYLARASARKNTTVVAICCAAN